MPLAHPMSRILDGCLKGDWNTFPPMAETRQAYSRSMGRSGFGSLGFDFEVLTGEDLEGLDCLNCFDPFLLCFPWRNDRVVSTRGFLIKSDIDRAWRYER